MKVSYREDIASHSDPESCVMRREAHREALTGAGAGQPLSREISANGMPTLFTQAEGETLQGVNREHCGDPARSETLSMPRSLLNGNWEISEAPAGRMAGGAGKAKRRNPAVNASEKSDTSVVPEKLPNKGVVKPAEVMEGRDVAKGNAEQSPAARTQSRRVASKGLEGVREAARRDRRMRFTALLHPVTPQLLRESYHALPRQAAAGVDGVTWRVYGEGLTTRLARLHEAVHKGTYRAQPSRRSYLLKADGKRRPLGIAALEDKIVQQALVSVLSAVYEQDFLGFSYGFRPGRSQHDALDALMAALHSRKVNWILDCDLQSFFDSIEHEWMEKFLEHRIADKRVLRLVRKWLKAGVIEEGKRETTERGTPQGAVISPLLANVYLHYALDLWTHHWRGKGAKGEVIVTRYADDGVPRTHGPQFGHGDAAHKMRAGPSKPACRSRLQTTLSCVD